MDSPFFYVLFIQMTELCSVIFTVKILSDFIFTIIQAGIFFLWPKLQYQYFSNISLTLTNCRLY